MPEASSQLDRIEKMLDYRLGRIENHLSELNGKVAKHGQTLYGPNGYTGLEHKVSILDNILRDLPPQGMMNTRTMWAAVGAISSISAVIASLFVGILQ